jgi:hypothetical protein
MYQNEAHIFNFILSCLNNLHAHLPSTKAPADPLPGAALYVIHCEQKYPKKIKNYHGNWSLSMNLGLILRL